MEDREALRVASKLQEVGGALRIQGRELPGHGAAWVHRDSAQKVFMRWLLVLWLLIRAGRLTRITLPYALSRPLPEQERRGVVCGVGEDRGEQPAGEVVEPTEEEAGEDCPESPEQVAPVGADVHEPEEERGDHDTKLLLHRAAEKRLLPHPREDRDEDQTSKICAVHETRGELPGYLPQRGQETVSE